jgi:AcrR family transcriptional regulator
MGFMARTETDSRPSEARERLLAAASRIFYQEGIRSVGVDRIIAEANVTRATFYRHFPSKEDLVLAYLKAADQAVRGQLETAITAVPAAEALRALAQSIAQDIQSAGFRGCAFLNAVTEYPDPDHPVHQAVLAHRQWFLSTVNTLMVSVQKTMAEPAAQHFVMLRDGAMSAGCLFDRAQICETFLRGIEGLIRIHAARQPS